MPLEMMESAVRALEEEDMVVGMVIVLMADLSVQ